MDPNAWPALYADHLRQLESGYARVLAATGYDAVVIYSGSAKLRSAYDDQYWPVRVTPHFQHWLPLAEPDCALIIMPGTRPKLLWTDAQGFWERPAPVDSSHWQSHFEILKLAVPDDARQLLPTGRVAFIGEERARAASWGFSEDDSAPKALQSHLDQLRTRKTAYEVACLAEANRRAAVGHDALAQAFAAGDSSEFDLHLLFLRATQQDDPETPYKNIVALGPNAATLHHVSYLKNPSHGTASQSLLVDAGATCFGYCSDITRTYVKGSGAAASAFAGLLGEVSQFQQRLCARVRVGDKYEALHDEAHREVASALRAVGLTRLSVDEAVAAGLTRAFFPHGLGHSLGLQCHDVGCALIKPRPDNPFLRNTSVISEGQCFTIEPGIYFIDSLLDKQRAEPHASSVDWKLTAELAQLGGIRIEDDLVVQAGPQAARNLTRAVLA
jgi:Xaa-Pro dipeptidase